MKNIREKVKYFSIQEKIIFPEQPCNVLLIIYTPMKYHFTLIFLAAKGTIYNVTIATAIFSRLQKTCYLNV